MYEGERRYLAIRARTAVAYLYSTALDGESALRGDEIREMEGYDWSGNAEADAKAVVDQAYASARFHGSMADVVRLPLEIPPK